MDHTLPDFRYHPDALRSGSIVASSATCRACGEARGYAYSGPVYSETNGLDDALCPWCIASGRAHERFNATFVDAESIDELVPTNIAVILETRTPGFHTWQSGRWPACCDDATAFIMPFGIAELRAAYRELEGAVLSHIIYDLGISGGSATRLLDSLRRDESPTGYLFQCVVCAAYHFHIDRD